MLRWNELTRTRLRGMLPEALVVVPTGATEQHGPHLPTGTDALLVETVVERAAEQATGCPRTIVVAPTLPVGASDHHLPFGATLSLTTETLTAVLLDLARSIAVCGGKRLVIVNGHGGNQGVLVAAGAAASNRYDLAVATTDYWSLLPAQPAEDGDNTVPGHAGKFETSLVLAVRPELVAERSRREGSNSLPQVSGFALHRKASWSDIEGYTDHPDAALAAEGEAALATLAEILAERFSELARTL